MGNKLIDLVFLKNFRKISKDVCLFLVLCLFFVGIFSVLSFGKEYINCDDRKIVDSFASPDYKMARNVGIFAGLPSSVSEANAIYYNLIGNPRTGNNSDYLFTHLNVSKISNIYLTCGFQKNDFVVCDSERLNVGTCSEKATINGGEVSVETCEGYNKVENYYTSASEAEKKTRKKACYPSNHICKRYKEGVINNYYSIEENKFGGATVSNNFYVYEKNVKAEGGGKNCDLRVYSCDLRLKNEYGNEKKYVNVIKSTLEEGESHITNNLIFIDNIFGGLGSSAYFKYKGTCKESEDTCKEILKAPYYYKYKVNEDILYFTKEINYKICEGYLPNCKYIFPTKSPTVLYNNTTFKNGGNNEKSRKNFYESSLADKNDVKNVREEHLFFISNPSTSEIKCLSIDGNSEKDINYDIGYCSDLNDGGTDLKYPEGLSDDYLSGRVKNPNCYLKSCIDLTKEELDFIENKSGGKYCSEYYWLKNSYGFKYFPREKTKQQTYCSELENTDKGKQLFFRKKVDSNGNKIGINGYKIKETDTSKGQIVKDKNGEDVYECPESIVYYGVGGGINKERNNCYLKSCFSMEKEERDRVVNAKALNLSSELERIKKVRDDEINRCKAKMNCTGSGENAKCECKSGMNCDDCKDKISGSMIDVTLFNEDNLSTYCEDTFLISSRFDSNFKDINMNVISCQDLEKRTGYSVGSSRILDSIRLINLYETSTSSVVCRRDYPIIGNYSKLDENKKIKMKVGSIFNTIKSKSGENSSEPRYKAINKDYKDLFSDSINYFKTEADAGKFDILDGINLSRYKSICKYIDNSILYYNATTVGIDSEGGFNKYSETLGSYLNILGDKKDEFLEKYVYKCRNYSTDFGGFSTFLVDCGLYTGGTEISKDILSIMEEGLKASLAGVCNIVQNANEPSASEVAFSSINPRSSIRTDEYNWLVKPTPINNVPSDRYDFEKNENLDRSSIFDIESAGCVFFENYYNDKVDNVISVKKATGIPWNKTNYVYTTNFSDPVYKRKNGDVCEKGEISCVCRNGDRDCNIVCNDREDCNPELDDCCKASEILSPEDYSITVGARFPSDVISKNIKCGFREGSDYRDLAIKLKIASEASILGDPNTEASSSDSDRFRSKIIKDKLLIFRDSKVKASETSNAAKPIIFKDLGKEYYVEHDIYENTREKIDNGINGAKGYYAKGTSDGMEDELFDLNGMKFIYLDKDKYHRLGYASKAASHWFYTFFMGWEVTCSTEAALATMFTFGQVKSPEYFFFTCLSVPIYRMADVTISDRRHLFLYYMNNSRNHILDYFDNRNLDDSLKTDSGLILSGNIFDNNNYLYVYYPRYGNIEDDIRSKLESNINRDGKRYYHNTISAIDIIRACKLENLVGDANNNGYLEMRDNANYNFVYYKLDKDGNRIGNQICDDVYEDGKKINIERCIAEELQECLRSYDVSFLNFNEQTDHLDETFIRQEGKHLKQFENDGSLWEWKHGESNGKFGEFIPVNIVAYTGNSINSNSEFNCQLDADGNPKGDLSRCRGFYYNELFYTESQAVPIPMYTHPFLYYTLITPKNTPELFEATFLLDKYFKFSNYKYSVTGSVTSYGSPLDMINSKNVVVDFFNPRFKFSYDYVGGSGDSELDNIFSGAGRYNDFISEIFSYNKKSYAYQVKYKSKMNADRDSDVERELGARIFKFLLEKVYDLDDTGAFIPKVCVYELRNIEEEGNWDNGICLKDIPEHGGFRQGAEIENNQCFMVADSDVACYERNIPFFDNFIFKLDESSTFYNRPFINVYLRPKNKSYYSVTNEAEKENYIMRESSEEDLAEVNSEYDKDMVVSKAINTRQGFGVNFERSHCSKLYYDYYTYVNQLQIEESKGETKNEVLINRLRNKINSIDSAVRPDCEKENGIESEFLINEKEVKPIKALSNNDVNKVIIKKTAIVKKYIESYGGFNEICMRDGDINNIFKYYNKQSNSSKEMPRVIAFKNSSEEISGRKTKCLLSGNSRRNKNCLIANSVYVYCSDEEKGINEACVKKLDITTHKYAYLKEIKCKDLFDEGKITGDVTDENIEQIKACYKGGFNALGTVYKRDGGENGEIETSCACEEIKSGNKVQGDYFVSRYMTPREYGLCVDLPKPDFCPAIKYFGEEGEYIDDNLALGISEAEAKTMKKEDRDARFEQHEWRTSEMISGILPSVFFKRNLGNAEFESSIYCMGDDNKKSDEYFKKNCIGGSKYVYGECRGYWKWDEEKAKDKAPKAICTLKKDRNGDKIYEYELIGLGCERYQCPNVGYDDNNAFIGDEKELEENSINTFTNEEIDYYNNTADKRTTYQSYINNEEQDVLTVDKRGSSHGFATWKNTESGDYAIEITSTDCMTGYGPAGSNYVLRNSMEIMRHNINYDGTSSFSKSLKGDNSEFINYIKNQQSKVNGVRMNYGIGSGNYPKRLCNQKGEWEKVNDIYNKKIVLMGNEIKEDNYYYNNNENYWVKSYNNEFNNFGMNIVDFGGYCERNVCPAMIPANVNIYDDEVLGIDSKKFKIWNHNGGAVWTNTSAPRNSSEKIDNTSNFTNISRNVTTIFTEPNIELDEMNNNKYKYLKRAQGICYTDYGYYFRNTKFSNDKFSTQYISLAVNNGNNEKIDPRTNDMVSNINETIRPERICTSYGLWGEVINRCFRGCEMMDVYRTTFSEKINNMDNFNVNSNYFVENNDIISINKNIDTISSASEEVKERVVEKFKLDKNHGNLLGNFITGDFLTGGAQWPRSLVSIDSKVETSGPKKGLRYVMVEGVCDSSYTPDIDGKNKSEIRTYIIYEEAPKRKCYEDGSWGPVIGNSRCILSKNCTQFFFTLLDLKRMIEMYNSNINNLAETRRENLSEFLAGEITFNKDRGNDSELCKQGSINNCIIYNFSAEETSKGNPISKNKLEVISESAFISPSKSMYPIVCNSTEMSVDNRYNAGWSLDDDDIGEYFIPQICNEANISYFESGIGALIKDNNSGAIVNKNLPKNTKMSDTIRYAKESKLQYVYDALNKDTNPVFPTAIGLKNNDLRKKIKIGTKNYNSYQMLYNCNDTYYYNIINACAGKGKNCKYYNRDIVLECRKKINDEVGGNAGLDYIIAHNTNTDVNNSDSGNLPMHSSKCYIKTCGNNNGYQKKWSLSYIKEALEGSYPVNENNLTDTKSYVTCGTTDGIEMAFVLKDDETTLANMRAKGYISPFTREEKYINEKDKVMEKSIDYSSYGYYKSIRTDCELNDNNKTINGTNANNLSGGEISYDIQRYGKLNYSKIPKQFCKDKEKLNCKNLSEAEVFAGDINSIYTEKEGYCVPMACKGKGLKLIFEGEKARITEDKNGFNLDKDYYNFGDYVIIESVKEDFTNEPGNGDNIHSYPISEIKSRAELNNLGNLCGANQDLYNKGKLPAFDFYVYVNETNLTDKKSYINKCFSWLTSNSAISSSSKLVYTEIIKDNLYVGFNDTYKEEKKVVNLYDAVNSYNPNATKQAEFRKKAAEFIVDNLVFKNGGTERENYNFDTSIETSLEVSFNDLKKNAVASTNSYFEKNNKNDLIYCYNEETESKDFMNVISGNIDKNLKKVKYNDILEDSNKINILSKFIEITGNTNIDFYIKNSGGEEGFVGFLVKEKDSKCNGTVTKKIKFSNISATSQRYKKNYCSDGYTYDSAKLKCLKNIVGVNGYYEKKIETSEDVATDPVLEKVKKCFKVEVFADSDIYEEDGIKWTKDTESCEILEEIEPEVTLDTSNYKCFYDIDSTNGEVTNYCDVKEFDINNSIDNCSDKYLVNNKEEIYKDLLGNEYVPNKEIVSSCENRDFIADEKLYIVGDAIQSLDVYISKYNANYIEEINEFKNKLKNDIADSKSGDIWYELLNEYYSIYEMEDFLNIGNNLEYYKYYIDEVTEKDEQITKLNNGHYLLSIPMNNNEDDEIFTGTITFMDYYLVSDKIGCVVANDVKNIDDVLKNKLNYFSCSSINQTAVSALNSFYKKYFINFLSTQKESIKTTGNKEEDSVGGLYDEYVNSYNNCKILYNDYLKVKSDYDTRRNNNSSNFGSGLFMAMQCTPEGWKVLDKLTCKDRCSGVSDIYKVDPKAIGEMRFRAKVSNLRYNLKASIYVFGHATASCYKHSKYTRNSEVVVRCGDNGIVETVSGYSDGEGSVPNDDYCWYKGAKCWGDTYYTDVDGKKYYEGHSWTTASGAKLFSNGGKIDKDEVNASIWADFL